jgi:hypothetical protein
MTPEELARDLATIEAATEGPWEIEWPDYDYQKECYDDPEAGECRGAAYLSVPGGKGWKHFASVAVICMGDPDEEGAANARFMVAAKERWPLYVAEVERQAARIKELENRPSNGDCMYLIEVSRDGGGTWGPLNSCIDKGDAERRLSMLNDGIGESVYRLAEYRRTDELTKGE